MISSFLALSLLLSSPNYVDYSTSDFKYIHMVTPINVNRLNNYNSYENDINSILFYNHSYLSVGLTLNEYDNLSIKQYSYINNSDGLISFDGALQLYQSNSLPLFDYNIYTYDNSLSINDDWVFNVDNSFIFSLNNYVTTNDTLYLHYYCEIDISQPIIFDSDSWEINSTNCRLAYSTNVDLSYSDGYNNGITDAYDNGYNVGYNNGYNSRQSTIDDLQNQINNLQELINDYREGRISLESLMWTIASLPFESFKQIWNVELLGINLGGFALGLMFVGIVLFIWKKFI